MHEIGNSKYLTYCMDDSWIFENDFRMQNIKRDAPKPSKNKNKNSFKVGWIYSINKNGETINNEYKLEKNIVDIIELFSEIIFLFKTSKEENIRAATINEKKFIIENELIWKIVKTPKKLIMLRMIFFLMIFSFKKILLKIKLNNGIKNELIVTIYKGSFDALYVHKRIPIVQINPRIAWIIWFSFDKLDDCDLCFIKKGKSIIKLNKNLKNITSCGEKDIPDIFVNKSFKELIKYPKIDQINAWRWLVFFTN